MGTTDRSVQFAGGTLGRHRHICAFFNSLDEEHRVLRLFIKDGPVVQVRDSNDHVYVDEDTDSRVVYDGPLIVLTSSLTSSAMSGSPKYSAA